MESTSEHAASPNDIAADLLVALRTGESGDASVAALDSLSEGDLAPVREDHETGLAFWLNCYNAATLRLLAERPGLYDSRWRFFRAPALSVAGHALSLDDIEHGLLRGSRSKYGLGYLPRLLPDSFEHRYRLSHVDPRIHFALNCGAESCPPILAYDHEAVDEQLDTATAGYLDAEAEYDADRDMVRVPRLMLWYHGDFGGRAGVLDLLRRHEAIPADATPRLRYRSYDWSVALGRFATATGRDRDSDETPRE